MLDFLQNVFGGRIDEQAPEEPDEQPLRTVATIRAELGVARDSVEPLAAKLATAQNWRRLSRGLISA